MTLEPFDFLTFSELLRIIETDTSENNFKKSADFLLTAVTDWPTKDLKEPAEIVLLLKSEIKKKLTFENLDNYSKTLTIERDAWKKEAISSLLEMFDFQRNNLFNKTIELETIIDNLTKHYRLNNKSYC